MPPCDRHLHAVPSDRPRDVEDERLITRLALAGLGKEGAAVAAALIEFAEERAEAGPVRDVATRDLMQDGLEELADCRNYLVWAIQDLERLSFAPDRADALQELYEALAETARSFARIKRAQELARRARVAA